MICVICDVCRKEHRAEGPNTGAVVIPAEWVEVTVKQHMKPFLVQHQCGSCHRKILVAMQQQTVEHAKPQISGSQTKMLGEKP